jgi:hypothetical protein
MDRLSPTIFPPCHHPLLDWHDMPDFFFSMFSIKSMESPGESSMPFPLLISNLMSLWTRWEMSL